MIETGYVAEAWTVVQQRGYGCDAGSSRPDRFPEVFATSRMIALMELAAARAMHPLLQPGHWSVGVGLRGAAHGRDPGGVPRSRRASLPRYEGSSCASKWRRSTGPA